jgi:phosphatidylglycerol---prolipoprotein diacylglyceryl transferase
MNGVPYIDLPHNFGPINLFGLLMAIGVLFGSWLARKYVERNGMDEETLRFLGIRLLVWGFLGAFIFNTVFYEWDSLMAQPWKTVRGLGISSYGAIVAGAIGFFYYSRKLGLDRRRWADMTSWPVAGGWLLGRLGCAVVHDHLGQRTDSPFGVNAPIKDRAGNVVDVVRTHDLGLYEFGVWVVLLAAVLLLERWRGRKPGFLLGFVAVAYSIPRFLFEYLRLDTTDPRYGGLTFAQWASIGFFAWGLWLLFGPVKPAAAPAEAAAPAAAPAPAAAGPAAGGGASRKKKKRKR